MEAALIGLELLDQLARIGQDGHGITRLGYSAMEDAAFFLLEAEMKSLGLHIMVDDHGNLYGYGGEVDAVQVMFGSHLDTVPQGGAYDGAYGVVGALVAMTHLAPSLRQKAAMVVFRNEESARFGVGCLGSLGATAGIPPELWQRTDQEGVTLETVVPRIAGFPHLKLHPPEVYLELHIEQGKIMRDADLQLAWVSEIAGPARYEVHFTGYAAHSGATALPDRKDALLAAAAFMRDLEAWLWAQLEENIRATVGQIKILPGATNVIPGSVSLALDVRSLQVEALTDFKSYMQTVGERIGRQRSVEVTWETWREDDPIIMQEDLQNHALLTAICPSWPYHDAAKVADLVPVAMLFVRNISGTSHNADEKMLEADLLAGFEAFALWIQDLLLSGS